MRYLTGMLAGLCLAGAAHAAVIDEAMAWLATRPDGGELPVYLSVDVAGLWPRQLALQVGGGPPSQLLLNPAQARALAAGGVLRVPGVPRTAGRVQLELGLSRDQDPAAPVELVRRRELLRPELHGTAALRLRLRRSAWRLWRTGLDVERIDPTAELDGQAADLLREGGAALDAAVLLLRQPQLSPAGWRRLGDARAALGLDGQPQWQTAAEAGDAAAALQLAEAAAHADRPAQAARWLVLAAGLPGAADRLNALRLRLAQITTAELSESDLASGVVALAIYNQAAATGALEALERLGAVAMTDPLGWAVRDQANLALGYHYLDRREPGRAREAFSRVRALGPSSAAGRLGLGWAQVAPGGGAGYARAEHQRPELRPRGEDARAEARRATPFRTAGGIAHGELARELRQALLPWSDLIGADPLDPAVQESMLAIPYALVHLGAHEDALQRTTQAVASLQELQQALAAVDRDALIRTLLAPAGPGGNRWWRQTPLPAGFYRERLLAEPGIATRQRECATLEEVGRRLAREDGVEPGLDARLAGARTACRDQLAQRSGRILAGWQEGLAAYLAEAHLALARLHDRGRPVLAPGPQ